MIEDVEKAIREYLPNVIHMSLATTYGNQPWICEVHFVYDTNLNIYFRSKPNRRHSKEISINNKVAGNIIKQHSVGEKPRGVYFEGNAELLNNIDRNHIAYQLYCDRFKTESNIIDEARTDDGHKFYKISVEKFYLFDSAESHPSTKYVFPWNKQS